MPSPSRAAKERVRRLLAEVGRRRMAHRHVRDWRALGRPARALDGTDLPSGPVLVLAPHVDDETLGAGATLVRHAERGDGVCVVYLTDSAASASPDLAGAELAAARRQEAEAVARRAGFAPPRFATAPDGGLESALTVAADAVVAACRDAPPAAVYLPAPVDAHPDHRAAEAVLAEAQRRAPDLLPPALPVMAMQLHTPLSVDLGTVWVPAGPHWQAKLHLLSLFGSQTMSFANFLAAQRAFALPPELGPGEPFVRAPLGPFLAAAAETVAALRDMAALRSVSAYRDPSVALAAAAPAHAVWRAALVRAGVL